MVAIIQQGKIQQPTSCPVLTPVGKSGLGKMLNAKTEWSMDRCQLLTNPWKSPLDPQGSRNSTTRWGWGRGAACPEAEWRCQRYRGRTGVGEGGREEVLRGRGEGGRRRCTCQRLDDGRGQPGGGQGGAKATTPSNAHVPQGSALDQGEPGLGSSCCLQILFQSFVYLDRSNCFFLHPHLLITMQCTPSYLPAPGAFYHAGM